MCGNSQKLNDEPSYIRLDICVKNIDKEKETNSHAQCWRILHDLLSIWFIF